MNRFSALSLFLVLSSATARIREKEEQAPQQHHPRARLLQTSGEKIENQYIVKLLDGTDRQGVMDAVFADNPTASVIYEETIMSIADRFPGVVSEIEEDAKAEAAQLVWGLDRIDDKKGLDGSFIANVDGAGVDIYVMDVSTATFCL
jgi:hypothetical protein